jgi:hypothetical protein
VESSPRRFRNNTRRDNAARLHPGLWDDSDAWGFAESNEFGFTPAARLAFLRENGVDPIDLRPWGRPMPGEVSGMTQLTSAEWELPFFPNSLPMSRYPGASGSITAGEVAKTEKTDWNGFRLRPVMAFRRAMAEAVGATATPAVAKVELHFEQDGNHMVPWSEDLARPGPAVVRYTPSSPPRTMQFVSVHDSVLGNGMPRRKRSPGRRRHNSTRS